MITNTSLITKPLRDTPQECLEIIVASAVQMIIPEGIIFVLPNEDCAVEDILTWMFQAYNVPLLVSQICDVPHFIDSMTGERLLEFRSP